MHVDYSTIWGLFSALHKCDQSSCQGVTLIHTVLFRSFFSSHVSQYLLSFPGFLNFSIQSLSIYRVGYRFEQTKTAQTWLWAKTGYRDKLARCAQPCLCGRGGKRHQLYNLKKSFTWQTTTFVGVGYSSTARHIQRGRQEMYTELVERLANATVIEANASLEDIWITLTAPWQRKREATWEKKGQ